ncbi:MAG: hypothetical protein L0H29_05070, partial [Sinobacteraceae bacterium]|nr:hypothetical protein [Nevskiaceae bacterium]
MTHLKAELPQRFAFTAWPAFVAGLVWLCAFDDFGGFILAVVPGSLLLASGVSLLLWPGTAKITQLMALGGLLGVVLGIPQLFVSGFAYGIIVIILSAVSYLCAGRAALRLAARPDDAPPAPTGWRAYAKAALDEALMGYFVSTAQIPSGEAVRQLCAHFDQYETSIKSAAWATPSRFNPAPPAPQDASLQAVRAGRTEGELLSFSSGYEPPAELPSPPKWLRDPANAKCRALVFRHPDNSAEKPWLIGIHGYRMGQDLLDAGMFPPRLFTQRMGCNLLLPVLPLHGRRKAGWRSGDHYLDGEMLDFLYAQAQALWDLRRTVAWIRQQSPTARIGVLGYSLGGYNTALLAAHEKGLDFAVAGIPLAEPVTLLWSVLPQPHRTFFDAQGLDPVRFRKLMKLVSPLALAPKLDKQRLAIFAGTADR